MIEMEMVRSIASNLAILNYFIGITLLALDINFSALNDTGFNFRPPLNIISRLAPSQL
jgi:hypothetical protein